MLLFAFSCLFDVISKGCLFFQQVAELGNEVVNKKYEQHLPPYYKRPTKDDPELVLSIFSKIIEFQIRFNFYKILESGEKRY